MFRNFLRYGKRFVTTSTSSGRQKGSRILSTGLALAFGYGGYYLYSKKRRQAKGMFSKTVRERKARSSLRKTFSHVSNGLLVTAGASMVGYSMSRRMFRFPPLLAGLGMLGSVIGCVVAKEESSRAKWYYAVCLFTGFSLCSFAPHILIRAAGYTAALASGVTASVYLCRDIQGIEAMLATPLFVGLQIAFFSSIFSLLFQNSKYPTLRSLAAGSNWMVLYGGLFLFTAFLFYDMRLVHNKYLNLDDSKNVDHVRDALSIYLDLINILVRIATLLKKDD